MNQVSNSSRRTASIAAALLLALGASACGGGADASSPSTTVAAAETTVAPTTNPATTVAPTTTVLIESTDELAAFAAEHGELVSNWSSQLEAFGDQALENLADVSATPGSEELRSISDEVADAIGIDATDPGLVTVRDFAAGISGALAQSADGDQEGALTSFFALQAQSEALSSAITLIEA